MKFDVEPVSADVSVPPHPVEGPMPPEGAAWIADQYTLRLIADGVIRRVPEHSAEEAPADREAGATDALVAEPAPAEAAPAEATATDGSAPGTVASVPFMITAAMRRRLRALGKTDDEIANLTPAQAQALLTPADPAAPGEAQEA